jgi:hypothetical protein
MRSIDHFAIVSWNRPETLRQALADPPEAMRKRLSSRQSSRDHEPGSVTGQLMSYGQEGTDDVHSVCCVSESRGQIRGRVEAAHPGSFDRFRFDRTGATGLVRGAMRGAQRTNSSWNEERATMMRDPDKEKDRCANTGLLHGSSIGGVFKNIGIRSDRRQTA